MLKTRIFDECHKLTPANFKNIRQEFQDRLYYCQEVNDTSIAIVSPSKSKNSYKKQINFDHTPTRPTSHNLKDREIFINILRGMTSMKYEIRENTKKLNRIENMLNDIMKNSNKHLSSSLQTNNDSLIENNYFSIFPLKNMDELTILEDKLNDNDFRLKLQSYLARLERPSVSDMTRQIMAKMFHNNLLAQFSYAGQKKKKIFSILNSCTIIFASVRSVQAHRNCTDLEILKNMNFFVANAKFREEKKSKQ
ncbi:uncharacterized protein LOC126554276 [Aphis gossypii]|uniref:uncharacterized protein LOC126554276 n=1 Tax=Aphis gossypii TaxID=80765 RepID=UPI002158BCE6|nr:uncharacterized protein LOC126554276 [Aphis gossypii]